MLYQVLIAFVGDRTSPRSKSNCSGVYKVTTRKGSPHQLCVISYPHTVTHTSPCSLPPSRARGTAAVHGIKTRRRSQLQWNKHPCIRASPYPKTSPKRRLLNTMIVYGPGANKTSIEFESLFTAELVLQFYGAEMSWPLPSSFFHSMFAIFCA